MHWIVHSRNKRFKFSNKGKSNPCSEYVRKTPAGVGLSCPFLFAAKQWPGLLL